MRRHPPDIEVEGVYFLYLEAAGPVAAGHVPEADAEELLLVEARPVEGQPAPRDGPQPRRLHAWVTLGNTTIGMVRENDGNNF